MWEMLILSKILFRFDTNYYNDVYSEVNFMHINLINVISNI